VSSSIVSSLSGKPALATWGHARGDESRCPALKKPIRALPHEARLGRENQLNTRLHRTGRLTRRRGAGRCGGSEALAVSRFDVAGHASSIAWTTRSAATLCAIKARRAVHAGNPTGLDPCGAQRSGRKRVAVTTAVFTNHSERAPARATQSARHAALSTIARGFNANRRLDFVEPTQDPLVVPRAVNLAFGARVSVGLHDTRHRRTTALAWRTILAPVAQDARAAAATRLRTGCSRAAATRLRTARSSAGIASASDPALARPIPHLRRATDLYPGTRIRPHAWGSFSLRTPCCLASGSARCKAGASGRRVHRRTVRTAAVERNVIIDRAPARRPKTNE
jgi:hypothetical protein